jgi:hypothetical protein
MSVAISSPTSPMQQDATRQAAQQSAREIRDQVRTEIQQAIRGATRGARNVEVQVPAIAGGPFGPNPDVIATLQAQIQAERANIQVLAQSLSPGMTRVQERAIQGQIDNASTHLHSLEMQLARALNTADQTTEIQVPPNFDNVIPQQAVEIVRGFFITMAVIAIGIPLARAFGRWLDRRGNPASAAPADTAPRLERIEQAIEAVAIEVERISEGQRYTNRIMSEIRALPAPNPLEQWPAEKRQEKVER